MNKPEKLPDSQSETPPDWQTIVARAQALHLQEDLSLEEPVQGDDSPDLATVLTDGERWARDQA